MKKWQAGLLTLFGALMTTVGGTFIGLYIWSAVISRIGEPDQSLLFWYLPILFLGIVVGVAGLSLAYVGIKRIKANRKDGS